MSRMIHINYSFMLVLLLILLLGASVPTLANGYYEDPSDSNHKVPTNAPKESKVKCQGLGNLCSPTGDYTCCEKLACRASDTVGGILVCLPPLPIGMDKEPPKEATCQQQLQVCAGYGVYDCCGDLSCVLGSPRPVNAIGVGLCLPLGRKKETVTEKCQKLHNFCHPYGRYNCCSGLTCIDLRNIDPQCLSFPPGSNHKTDFTQLPLGFGVCLPS